MNAYAFIGPEVDENELPSLYAAAAPLSVETETGFALARFEHDTWRRQIHRTFMWAALWGDKRVLVNRLKLVGQAG